MRTRYIVAALCFGFLAALVLTGPAAHGQPAENKGMVYEIRTYTTHPGRLEALNSRFRDHTTRLFVKHGMRNIGYWIPTDPELRENTLIYVVAHDSLEAAEQSWQSFRNDPEWKQAAAESEKDGKIVAKITKHYMLATDYSPLK